MARGFFGVGIVNGKTPENMGALWRSAQAFGASFMFTIGARYPRLGHSMDTTKAWRHKPLMELDDLAAFHSVWPRDTTIIGIENDPALRPEGLVDFRHPERAIYLLGAEDDGLPPEAIDICRHIVVIPTTYCLNVATAGALVMYDRLAKESRDE